MRLCRLGSTGLEVTPLGMGTSALASIPRDYGYEVAEARAIATVEAVLASPINFVDTSNGYGEDGAAERRIGAAIRRAGGLPRASCSPPRSTPTRAPATSRARACPRR